VRALTRRPEAAAAIQSGCRRPGTPHHLGSPNLRLRVCIVTPYDLSEEGGVKKHVLHLADRLRGKGDEVTVVGPLSGSVTAPGVHGFGGVVNVPANGADNRMALFTPPWEVRRFFAEHPFDVVHLHEPLVPLLTYYATWLTPAAAHVATFHMFAEDEGPLWNAVRRGLARTLSGAIDRGIAVSRVAAAFAARSWPGPLSVIPNGVSTATFRPRAADAPTRNGAPPRMLFVGSWRDERKGLGVLLEAHRLLRRAGLAVTLDVAGAGPAGPPPALPGVTFHGVVETEEELARLYRGCDIFVSPATGQESFGMVLLEAMASGVPVVCSDIPGYRDVVPAEGGRRFPAGDAGALAEAVRGLAAAGDDARRRLGEVNRRAAEAYEWDVLADRVRGEYVAAQVRRHEPAAAAAPCRRPDATA